MTNYLYPGAAVYVNVPGHGMVPYYDYPEDIPNSARGKVAVGPLGGNHQVGDTIWTRQLPAAYPGAAPGNPALFIILIAVLIVIYAFIQEQNNYIDLLRLQELTQRNEIPDTVPTNCNSPGSPCSADDIANGVCCYGADVQYGLCWWRRDCCAGTLEKMDPTCVDALPAETDWMGTLITLAVIGAGAYIGFKIILPALTKKKE